eukprot:TRINITY_DN8250_c0_g1_i2.p1 TRINITY_DN8250_c0_g1~~TRINITY_DN8250_c0_g1_i2.p1  ORF type:complete len:505 (+),score=94.66 TRINITY_DN8250_c0_g1_i2:105-1619(+)
MTDKPSDRIYFGAVDATAVAKLAQTTRLQEESSVDFLSLEFSDDTKKSQERYSHLIEQLELEKRARSIAVPTNDNMVKARLRELNEPIMLFGEQPPERRERLPKLLAKLNIDEGIPVSAKPAALRQTTTKRGSQKETLYYTEGTPKLRQARLFIANYSLKRAYNRIEEAKEKRNDGDFDTELKRFSNLKDTLSKYSNNASYIGDTRPLTHCSLSPDSSMIAISSWSGLCKLYTLAGDDAPVVEYKGHQARVSAAIFHPQSCISQSPSALNVVSCSQDKSIRLWSLESPSAIGLLEGHTDRVSRIAFHPSGRYLASSSHDTTWKLWDVEEQVELLSQEGHSRGVYGIAFQNDGSLIATSGLDAFVRVWDLRSGKTAMVLRGHAQQVLGLDFSPNGYHLSSGSEDRTIKVWDMRKRKAIYTIPAHMDLISDLKYQKDDGNVLVSCSFDKTCKIWSCRDSVFVKDWAPIKTLAGHEGHVMSVDISADAKTIVSASADRTFKVYGCDE